MAKVTIDGKSTEVDNSYTVLRTARELGVYIPTLCFDPALTPFGACRICMVEMEPGNRLVAACHTMVMDNMVIHTDSERVRQARKLNMELVLSRHPLDCLVCERGGDCQLQTVCFEVGLRAGENLALENRLVDVFKPEPMHLVQNDNRSLIERDLNKCILCRKCVRTCKEIAGVGAISYSNRGFYADVCTFYGRKLDCEFCGQCVERCPVGALFPKKTKYQSRIWQTKNVETVCNFCGCGCKLILRCKDNTLVKVRTDLQSGANKGRLCVRGHFGYDFVNHPQRIRRPMIRKEGKLKEVSWEKALDYTAKQLKRIKKKYGGAALAGIGSLGVTNEDNYLFQKMFRMALGSNNLDNYVRYEHAPTIAAMRESLGYPAMTNPMADLHFSDLIVVIGADLPVTTPVLGMEVKQAAAMHGADLIVIDPRRTKLVRYASEHLALKPGSDISLLSAIAQEIIKNNLVDKKFIEEHTEGYQELAEVLEKCTLQTTEEETGIPGKLIQEVAENIGRAEKVSFVFGTGVTQHEYGTDLVHTIINLTLLTGNIGKKGAGLFPVREYSNVQGACDMGVLPDLLPGYAEVSSREALDYYQEKWGGKLPDQPGATIPEMFRQAKAGKIKGMYILGEDPLAGTNNGELVKNALEKLDFLVAADYFKTETTARADVVFPLSSFAEKDGTATNTERRIQKVSKALPARNVDKTYQDTIKLGEWEIIKEISNRLGYEMNYTQVSQITDEIAETVPLYQGATTFGIRRAESPHKFEKTKAQGFFWSPPGEDRNPRLYESGFPGGKAHFKAIGPSASKIETSREFPYLLITGKELFNFHTGQLCLHSEWMSGLIKGPRVCLNPTDAEKTGVEENNKLKLRSQNGEIVMKAHIDKTLSEGILFLPAHYGDIISRLIGTSPADPESGTPEIKHCAVALEVDKPGN